MPDHGAGPLRFCRGVCDRFPIIPSPEVCYPTSVSQSEDGTEIRKYYDLGPEEDPAGIPRSDFEQDGFRYTLIDLLKQNCRRTRAVSTQRPSLWRARARTWSPCWPCSHRKKEFITEDGLSGVLTLQLDTVQVEVAG